MSKEDTMTQEKEELKAQFLKEQKLDAARLLAFKSWGFIGCAVLFFLVVKVLGTISDAVNLLCVGLLIGFVCSPATNYLSSKGVNRSLSAFLSLLLVFFVIFLIGNIILPSFVSQIMGLAKRIPEYSSELQGRFTTFMTTYGTSDQQMQQTIFDLVNRFSAHLSSYAESLVLSLSSGVLTNLLGTINFLVIVALGMVLGYWFARDYPVIIREFGVIAGPAHKEDVTLLLAIMSRSMGGYMRGVFIMSIIDGSLSFLGFWMIGHPYAGLMGAIIGLLHPIPVVGPWVSSGFAALVALFTSPILALETIIVVVIVQNITDNLISPIVMQSAVKVHPVLSLVAIAIGANIGGVLGMTLSIPLSAAIKGVFVYYFEKRTGRQLVSDKGALFKSTAFVDVQGKPIPSMDALDDAHFFDHSRLVDDPDIEIEKPLETEVSEEGLATFLKYFPTTWKNSKGADDEENQE